MYTLEWATDSNNISGNITNASGGFPLSIATVQTNTGLSTTKNATGEDRNQMFSKNNKRGYKSFRPGIIFSLLLIAFLLSSNAASAGSNGTILVASNRYVVLDDPNTGSFNGTGFKNPTNSWGSNLFSGSETTITMWAMVMDKNGTPVPNTNVNFTLKNPIGTIDYTLTKSTDSNGLVNLSRDLNAKNYYGKWQVIANATSLGLNDSTSFIYNWWGCGGGAGCGGHGSQTLSSGAPINSPYSSGHDVAVNAKSAHQSASICMYCHLSYNGQGSTATMNTSDTHRNISCDNASCHGSITLHKTDMVIGACSNCHNRTDISDKNTLNGIVSNYSNSTSTIYNRYHTPNSTVPCIICHGPMHNITKPDESQRFIKNNETESSQCTTCHSTYSKHNGGVNCTFCHSDDVHAIKVFAQNATYVTLNHENPNPARGNCTNCHQNATFLTALKSQPSAGNYTGSAAQIPKPLNHSTDRAGTKWGMFWTSAKDACIYCHGDNKHNATRLGNASAAVGTDTIGGSIGTGTVCSSCHDQGDSDYAAIIALLIPNPVANQPGTNWNVTGTDHSSYGTTDADCRNCHGGFLSGSADISEFVHNVNVGSGGGPDCVSCHDIGASQEKVDVSKMNLSSSIHNTLNSGAIVTRADNKRCYACHTNSTVSSDSIVNEAELPASGHPDKYSVPKKCTDCHTQGNFSALIVKEHNSAGTDIKTKLYANTNDSCVNCHNKSEMIITNNDPAGPKSQFANVSHYGSNKTGVSPYNTGGVSNCSYCHQSNSAFTTEMVNATWNSSINNHTALGTNPGCNNSACHNTGRIHDQNLSKPVMNTPLCKICHTTKEKHNNSLECGSCHLETNKSIHPIQYLQPSGAFLVNSVPNKTSAVDCTSCHQSMMSGFSSAAHVTTPLNHSNDNGGQKWGNFWTTQKDACLYCHGNSKHNASGLGTALTAIGTDPIGGSIGSGTLCSSCHNSGDSDYTAIINIFIPVPVANAPGSNYNSSGINHASYGMTDSDCLPCHGSVLSGAPTISEFPHNVASAGGCTACHGQPPNGAIRNNTAGAHTLHKNASYGSVPETGCNYCHSNGGLNEGGSHPNGIYNVSTNASAQIGIYTQVPATGNDDTCSGVSCHNKSLPSNAVAGTATWNTSTPRCDVCHSTSSSGVPATDDHLIHNVTKGYTCNTCHNGTGIHFNGGNANISFSGLGNNSGTYNTSWSNSSQTCIAYCHDPNGPSYAGGDAFAVWTNTTNRTCTSCHGNPPTITRNGVTHSTNTNCDYCHGSGALLGTQTGHLNGIIDTGSNTCNLCHAQPPSGISGSNTTGAHDLHKAAGYGSTSTTSCNYCHSNGGLFDGGSHPNGIYNISTNSSSQIATYTQVPATGKDDTCSGVSCHNKSLPSNAVAGTAIWNTSTQGRCDVCHSTSASGVPASDDHLIHNVTKGYTCNTCHNGAIHFNGGNANISFSGVGNNSGTYNTSWSNSSQTCIAYCHDPNGPSYAGGDAFAVWTNTTNRTCTSCHDNPPITTGNNVSHTTSTNCNMCHGTGAVSGTQTGHINGVVTIEYTGLSCISCHSQPPGGSTRFNTTGAHTIHVNAGYGDVPISGCDYCHSTGGWNNDSHYSDFSNAKVVPNSLATIGKYVMNPATGSDDTCSGVSCHTNGLSTEARVGTAIWNATTAGSCNYCHSLAQSGLPPTGNHIKHYTIENYSCATCHGQNADAGTQTGHKTNATIDINFTNISVGGSVASGTCTVYCHTPNPIYDTKPKPIWNTSSVGCGDCHSVPPITTRNNFTHPTEPDCDACHGVGASTGSHLGHIDGVVGGGGGSNCIGCHDIDGVGAPSNKRIKTRSVKLGVHKNLNAEASNSTYLDPINKACWACHGEGIEPSGHPARYKNPRECSNDDCHALSQLYKAPMVYSHFKDAELNDNPTDVLNYNVSTKSLCEDCHYNSLVETNEPKSNSSVSHYASTDKLIESVNCIYCHLDEDNAKDWGNATEINKNRTAMIQINRENNKFTAMTGDIIDLGTGYRIKVTGVSLDRGSAAIEIYKLDTLVDSGLIKIGEYVYEENLVIDNATVKTPVVVLNITDMFVSVNGSFIQFNGSRIKRVHPENRTTSCISCHYKGSAEKHKYVVMDRKDEDVYYTEVIFNSSDKELYDQEKFQKLLVTLTPLDKYLDIQTPLRTALKQGTSWDIGKDYRLTLKEVATDGKTALFDLEIGGRKYTDIVRKGEQLEYNLSINYLGNTYTEVTIFNATVKEIAQATPNIVVLEDVKALSPEIMSIKDNTTLYGYNTSWFWVDDTFMTGTIPQNLHVPLLVDGKVGGPDCISCHGTKDLGKHTALNVKASSGIASENKACWICHGDGNEPKGHPVTYNKPRVCKSCHADRVEPYYNATYIGDENHKDLANCSICHVEDTHKIVKFDIMPGIKDISVSKFEISPGEKVTLKATAIAGFNMKLKAAEYYIDSPDKKISMLPVDGSFDGQKEDLTAQVNTAGLKAGEHMIYVRAMERNDKWGPESSISFNMKEKGINISEEENNGNESEGILYVIAGTILFLRMGYSIYVYLMKR
jgi:predicted CxxxxCH...CXXCH cytochrome family protein